MTEVTLMPYVAPHIMTKNIKPLSAECQERKLHEVFMELSTCNCMVGSCGILHHNCSLSFNLATLAVVLNIC